jgi:hypothetical protein
LVCRNAKLSCKSFYGDNISSYDVTVSNAVPIIDIKTENRTTFFVTINTKNIPASDLFFTFKAEDKATIRQKIFLKQRTRNSAERQSFDASDMIYLLMPDRLLTE